MKFLVLLCSAIAIASARPTILHTAPAIYTATAPIQSQFHAQDALGQYSYGYSGGASAKAEAKTFDGITRGSYSYIDADGKLQSVEYTADSINGFRAAATNLPNAPIDNNIAPEPVQDTPEVAQARAEHLAAFQEAAIRAENAPEEPEEPQEEEQVTEEQPAQPESVAPITSITSPAATIHSTIHTLNTPPTSYTYHLEAPTYSYRIATPTVYTSPLTYAYAAPIIGHTHAVNIHGDILADSLDSFNGRTEDKHDRNGNLSY